MDVEVLAELQKTLLGEVGVVLDLEGGRKDTSVALEVENDGSRELRHLRTEPPSLGSDGRTIELPADIERLANELQVPISALIRGWVLAGLADERGTSLRGAIERLAEDADRLRRLAAKDDVA